MCEYTTVRAVENCDEIHNSWKGSIIDPTTLKIRPKVILPTGTITGWSCNRKGHLQVDKASVDPNAILLKTPL